MCLLCDLHLNARTDKRKHKKAVMSRSQHCMQIGPDEIGASNTLNVDYLIWPPWSTNIYPYINVERYMLLRVFWYLKANWG